MADELSDASGSMHQDPGSPTMHLQSAPPPAGWKTRGQSLAAMATRPHSMKTPGIQRTRRGRVHKPEDL